MKRKPTQKQKDFVHYYIKNGMNAYKAALSAGYTKSTAKNAEKNIMEKRGVKHLISSRMRVIKQRNKRHGMSDLNVIENLYLIASGSARKNHYTLHDLKDPSNSTDQIMIGPSATREQVNAIDLVLKYKGLEYSNSKKLEDAKSDKERAEAKVDQVKSKLSSKIYRLKFQLAKFQIRKTKAESEIKTIIAKENETNKNQTVSKLDEVLDAIFDNHDDQKKPK